MRILMMSNTFTPHVGGVARSVSFFTKELREMGNDVVVVAPEFPDMPEEEEGVLRVNAIQNFNGSDFSVAVPMPGTLMNQIDEFDPEVIHSHHPFLMGGLALRVASRRGVPLVFTHHTMYERYTHYVPLDSPRFKEFVVHLITGYANLCDQVIAPSESIADILRQRGVETPVESIPTGVYVEEFDSGDSSKWRSEFNIPDDAFVVGHLGRLAPEKNLDFLSRVLAEFLGRNPKAHFLVVGDGPSRESMGEFFEEQQLASRVHFTGSLSDQPLVDAYHAMDVFAFASKTETQGMVLIEAMAAGVPVVSLDAPGCREVVEDKKNGQLILQEETKAFGDALDEMTRLSVDRKEEYSSEAKRTAQEFSMRRCTERLFDAYCKVIEKQPKQEDRPESHWDNAMQELKAEWDRLANLANAAMDTFTTSKEEEQT